MGAVTKRLPWAEGSETREVFDACILAILGPRTAADDAPRPKKKNKKADKVWRSFLFCEFERKDVCVWGGEVWFVL